ncbi:MAG: GIY-YIG nuclease family protein [Chlorobi bacterium]|nr:GIY-YIG nuclease family protein [Chlorobiota bacterium]MBX7217595.1 GIY-YIG nuclease family protein [Candidatus Kapabacteria bacterium]MBX7217596.1 GIY-YIG nuclease family protein [Candidatus Kapabacteria bacterium]
MDSFFIYIIQSQTTGRFYIGQTNNVYQRVVRHNQGGCTATRNKGPWILCAVRAFNSRAEAMAEERALKAKKSSHFLRWYIQQFPPPASLFP